MLLRYTDPRKFLIPRFSPVFCGVPSLSPERKKFSSRLSGSSLPLCVSSKPPNRDPQNCSLPVRRCGPLGSPPTVRSPSSGIAGMEWSHRRFRPYALTPAHSSNLFSLFSIQANPKTFGFFLDILPLFCCERNSNSHQPFCLGHGESQFPPATGYFVRSTIGPPKTHFRPFPLPFPPS